MCSDHLSRMGETDSRKFGRAFGVAQLAAQSMYIFDIIAVLVAGASPGPLVAGAGS